MLSFQPPQGEDDSIFLQAGGETPFLRTCFKPHLVGAGVPDGPCWTWEEDGKTGDRKGRPYRHPETTA